MIDVGELMEDEDFVRSFTLRRPTGSFDVDGSFNASYRETQLRGIVQPASPREVLMLPEGMRLSDLISVWSEDDMRAADGKTRESDVLVVDGKYYRVVKAEPRVDAGYYRVLAEGYVP